jgi:hypothetical protein
MDEAEKEKLLKRLQALNETFIKGKTISSKQEVIWSFTHQVMGDRLLSKKQMQLLGEWEYKADTDGKGWEYGRGKSFKAVK